jgi:hypothetical protein
MEPNNLTPPVNPMPQTPVEPPRYRRPRSIVGPIILILLGLAFLAHNLNIFNFNVWEMMWRLWPVWLIAAGLDMVLGRRTSWGSWVVLGLVIAIVGGAGWWFSTNTFTYGGPAERVTISEDLHGATHANVEIKSGVGELRITGSSSDVKLVEGVINRLEGEQLSQDANGSNGEVSYRLKSEGVNVFPGIHIGDQDGLWDLRINKNVPMDLHLGTGVGKAEIDLSGLKLTSLDMNTGVGEARVTLPASGKFTAVVHSGIGKSTIEIPRGMAARIRVHQGIGAVNVHGDYNRDGSYYVSPDYDTNPNRVDLEVNGGIGEVQIDGNY